MALALDAATPGVGDSFAHITSGTNRALLVSVFIPNAETISGVTYGGVAMTKVGGALIPGENQPSEIWKLSNPASGSNTVTISHSAAAEPLSCAISFTGAEQNTANLTGTVATATGTSTQPTVNVASAAGEIVVDSVGTSLLTSLTAGAGQTERATLPGAGEFRFGASTEAGAGTVTMSWTGNVAPNWALVAVSVKEAIFLQILTPTAIGSSEAFGSSQANFGLLANAIASAEAFGADQLNLALLMNAIASAEAFGSPTMGLYLLPSSIAGEEAFGTAFLFFPIDPIGIPSAEAFGSGFVHFDIPLDPDLLVLLLPDLVMDVTGQVFSIPNVEEVDLTVSLTPDMDLGLTPQEWDFTMMVN
jgi:hypothetical protein